MMRRLLTIIIFLSIMVPAMAQRLIYHPWEGKRVAYFGDSITDPNNNGSTLKYWNYDNALCVWQERAPVE